MKNVYLILTIIIILFFIPVFIYYKTLTYEKGKNISFCGISTYGKCEIDEECKISGCSGQICQSIYEDTLISTCEFKECYEYKKYGYICKCINNKCQWYKI